MHDYQYNKLINIPARLLPYDKEHLSLYLPVLIFFVIMELMDYTGLMSCIEQYTINLQPLHTR